MADLPISGLPSITVPSNSYLLAAVSASITSQMTLAQVAAAMSSSFTASRAISASYATSASYEINYETSSSYADTASVAVSSSYALTASYALNSTTASYAISASYAITSSNAISSSYALTASYWLGSSAYTPTAYLAAFHTASLTIPSPNTPNTMSFSTVDFSQGITISGSWSDKIKVTNGGVYNLQFSAATTKTTGTAATIDIWLRKNESDLPYTNTIVTLAGGANDFAIPAWNFYVSASAEDYYQLMFASPTTNPYIAYAASGSTGVAVQVPSVILTVNRIA
jgi:hypothetical protein